MQLSKEEIANLLDAEFKTLVIRMLKEMVEYGHKIDGKSEGYEKWNKRKCTGNNSEGKETRTQINSLEQKEEINIQPEQNEEPRIQKSEERLRNLWDNFKCSSIWIIEVPEGEEEEQEIEILFEKIMKGPDWCGSVDWAQAVNQTVASSIPSQGTCLGCGPGPQ